MKKQKKSTGGFVERRREQLEASQKEAARMAMEEASQQLPGPSEEAGPEISRELATKYYEATSSWMHRFSDTRSDAKGFFLLHEDNPDAWRMKPGDLIQDVALNTQPYWEVVKNDRFETKRVSLKPIGPNPFVTGVGAGGARILPADIKVMTGEYEKDRIAAIQDLIEKGEYTDINDVKYALLGTCAVNFGPNGPQGGWYNASDSSCRGRRKGMKPIEVVMADAKTLRGLGFAISQMAINGGIPDDEWTRFVENPPGMFTDWRSTPPYDTEIYQQKLTAYYEAKNLLDDEWRRESLLGDIALWEEVIDLWKREGGLTYSEIEALETAGNWKLARKAKEAWGFLAFSTPEEDPTNINNAILMLNHRQSDVQMRAVSRCLMHIMSTDDESVEACYQALRRFIKSGHGYWLVNEQIILFAETQKDADLLIDASRIPDGTNRKYAYWGLIELRHPYVKKAVFTEDHPEALSAIASALAKHLFLPGRGETYYLLERLTDFMQADQGTMNRVWARDGLINAIHLARRQGLDTVAANEALQAWEQELRRNPDEPLTDQEWVRLTVLRMNEVISGTPGLAISANPEKPENPIKKYMYGGLPSVGGYSSATMMEVGAQNIAEAAHCILGSLGKADTKSQRISWQEGLKYERAHITEENGIIQAYVFRYRERAWDQGAFERMNQDPHYRKYVVETVASIRENSPKIRSRAETMRAALDAQNDMPPIVKRVGLLCYDLVIALSYTMEKSVRMWPDVSIGNPFTDASLKKCAKELDDAVTDLLEYAGHW